MYIAGPGICVMVEPGVGHRGPYYGDKRKTGCFERGPEAIIGVEEERICDRPIGGLDDGRPLSDHVGKAQGRSFRPEVDGDVTGNVEILVGRD